MQLDLVEVFGPYRKQVEFLTSPSRHRFFCAGRGAGKSWTLTLDVLLRALANPGVPGALLGRTERDLSRNLLPFLRDHLETLRRATGIDYVQRYSKADQVLELRNGATVHWRGYERIDKLRGQNLAWCALDEVCWSETDEITVWETVAATVRLPCPRPGLAVASSPNGMRGITRLFADRQSERDPAWWVTRCTSWDNPYLGRDVIESWRKAMSERRYQQEVMAYALRPSSVVFPEFDTSRHIVAHDWRAHEAGARWVFGVDWGVARAVAVAIQVLPDGRWIVVDERVERPRSSGHWRQTVQAMIDTYSRAPYLIAADRAIPGENQWLRSVWGSRRTIVMPLSTRHDQYVRHGVTAVSDMLAPVDAPPTLLFSASLPRTYDGDLQGIVPSMQGYRYVCDRSGTPTDRIYKDNVHDHAIDSLRYAIVAGLRFPDLHAGRLPLRHTRGP
ncbi:MAG: phage terminase large subunit, partial [Ilumatobacteraceae bacterium]